MAYRMTDITERVRVGKTSAGDFNIEIWTPSYRAPKAEMQEIFIPADAASELGKYLMLHS